MEASATFNFEAFLRGFADAGLEAEAAVKCQEIAKDIVERAQSLVHVLSSETRDSIMIQGEGADSDGHWIDIGSRLPKAFYEEFGTVHGPPVAFLRTAIAEALGGKGGFGVSWKQTHRPSSSRNRAAAKLSRGVK